ncbi:MAG TPA: NADH-ubiquinone oxidoreductase-F iron-sulfur binding region domain-containing protein, partial [Acidimicrobiales bacterium]|nr:NADH-ubiquinone oxidoreductase-F iron-sulfur binding region domain-containing protein [Acidimicrobiales bacterium]
EPSRLLSMVEASGLLGRGGAGFPVGRKLRTVADANRTPIVVVNAMEGEPATAKDRSLLLLVPHLVLDGAVLAAEAVGARQVVVCVAAEVDRVPGTDTLGLEAASASLQAAVDERVASGVDKVRVKIARPPHRYVAGESTAVARWLSGGSALPAFSRVRLAQRGVDGQPTLLQNAESMAQVALVARFGPEWFRSLGPEADPGTTLVTVSGAVRSPGVTEMVLGTTTAQLLAAVGGPSEPISGVLFGGYGGSFVDAARALELRLAHVPLDGVDATVGAGIVAAIPAAACGIAETARVARWMAGEGAGQCGPCLYGLPALADALSQLARPASAADAAVAHGHIGRWCDQIDGRGACNHPDGVVRLVRSAMTAFAADVAHHRRGTPCAHAERAPVLPVPHAPRSRP